MKIKLLYTILFICCCFSSQLKAKTILPPGDSTIVHNGCSGDGYEVLVAGTTTYNEVNPTGSETIVGGAASGADSVITVNLIFNPLPSPTIIITETSGMVDDDGIICSGDDAVLDAGIYNSYVWSDAGATTTQTLLVNAPGDYTVTVTDANGCIGTGVTTIISNPLPTPVVTTSETSGIFDNDGVVCIGDNTTLNPGNYIFYSWSTTETTETITAMTGGLYEVTVTDANGCEGVAGVTVVVNPLPTPTITISETSGAINDDGIICQDDVATLNVETYASYLWTSAETAQTIFVTASGDYTVWVTDVNGCEGTTTATIILNEITSNITNSSISCNGGSDGSVTVTASGGTGNYSYAWNTVPLQTTPTVTGLSGGSYTVTITDDNLCTVTATTNIPEPDPIIPNAIIDQNVSCNGGNDGQATASALGGTIAANYSYLWSTGQSTATATGLSSGDYTVTITDDNNCTATFSITITEPTSFTPTISISETSGTINDDGIICQGETATLDAGTYISYAWSTGDATQNIVVTTSGDYTVWVTDANGCQGAATITVFSENPTGEESWEGCQGDGYEVFVNGTSYNEGNPYGIEAIDIGSGCDSIVTIDLNFYFETFVNENYVGCEGDGYIANVNGVEYNEANPTGVEVISGGNLNGCDSTITINMVFHPHTFGNEDYVGCEGDGYEIILNGVYYNEANPTGVETIVGGNTNGCDSTVTINLLFNPHSNGSEDYTGCQGDGYNTDVNGTTYDEINPTGTEVMTNLNGCDSIVTINLIFNPTSSGIENYTGLEGDGYSVNVNGIIYNEANPSGVEVIPGGNSLGCDSIVTINLIFDPTGTGYENYTGCQGDGYGVNVNGVTYNEANPTGTEVIIGGAFSGMDSTILVNLVYHPNSAANEDYTGCEGDGYEWIVNGTTYNEANPTGTEVVTNYLGCDSTISINFIYHPASYGTEEYVGCEGDLYNVIVNGNQYNEANPNGTEVLTNTLGCDSIVDINLLFNSGTTGTGSYIGCVGDGYEININGTIYDESNPSGVEVIPGGNSLGCDSTITVILTFNPSSTGMESYTGQEGDGYAVSVNGIIYNEGNPSGTEILTNALGCDSIVTIDLIFYPPTTGFLNYQGCSGDGYSVDVNGVTYNENNPSGTEILIGGSSLGTDSTIIINLAFTILGVNLDTDVFNLNCETPIATLSPIITGLPDSPNYSWSTGETAESILVTFAGDYTVTITEATGCSASSSITIIESVPTECVFPGDANYDFVVNSLDHLTVCLAGGDTGPARMTQGINFLPHYAVDWNEQVLTNLDKKHLDCNGDGTIGYADLSAVDLNYYSEHDGVNPLRTEAAPYVRLIFDDLYIIEGQNTMVTGSIILDNPETQEDIINLYGIAFSIDYDQQFIEEGTFNITYLDNGWLGTVAEIAPLYKDFHSQGYMDVAFTRGDQVAASGSGVIATVQFVIEDNLIGLTNDYTIPMGISQIYAHDNLAEPIAFNGEADDVNISVTSTQDILSQNLVDVYPNPTSNELIINMNDLDGESYQIYNAIGQVVLENTIQNEVTSLNVKNLSAGLYILNIKAKEGSINIKIIIE